MHANYKFLSLSANFKLTTQFQLESDQKQKTILTLDNTFNTKTLIVIGHRSIDSIYLFQMSDEACFKVS